MCGIAGLVQLRAGASPDRTTLARMAGSLRHRGPDDSGVFVRGCAGLAHARLSVIDLVSGHQPMLSDDGRVAVAFNGEVYNFRDLRADLEREGVVFRTTSDTEVLIRMYEARGLDAFEAFNAQLACAVWDDREQTLVLARDRLGKKPLYYALTPDRFVFGSELKALLVAGLPDVRVDPAALAEYLSYGYIAGQRSILAGVHRLAPGHVLTLKDGAIGTHRYWRPDLEPRQDVPSQDEADATVERLLRAAVERRMIADVPLGAFLSGGLDSSLVVALMSEISTTGVRTFSVGFEETDYSELADAKRVATHLGTEHTEIVVRPSALDVLDDLVWHFDEPFADASMVPTYFVCQAARRHVTVALSGDGGDEVFAGYERYFGAEGYGRGLFPRSVARPLSAALPFTWSGYNWLYEVAHADPASLRPRLGLYPYVLRQLVRREFAEEIERAQPHGALDDLCRAHRGFDPVRLYQLFDTEHYLPGDILTKVDRASMAVSLEVRSPLLDYELIEYVSGLPTSMKLEGGVTKRILRRLAGPRLPAETLDKKKQGFAMPKGDWFAGPLHGFARNLLLDRTALERGWFRKGVLESMLDQHAAGRRDYGDWIWALLVLELWHRTFVDGGLPDERIRTLPGEAARYVS